MLDRRFLNLLIRTICALVVCAGLVGLCYLQIDRPVALWASDHWGFALDWLRWGDIITVIAAGAPLLLVWAAVTRMRRPWRRGEALLVAIAASIVVMIGVKQLLKFIFGRPSTRIWIANGGASEDFSFRWFHGLFPYDAFPSGHMIIAGTVAAMVWLLWPKWRLAAVAAIGIVAGCLIITNYHFVGDIVAGGFIGWLGGIWAVHLMPRSILPSAGLAESTVREGGRGEDVRK